MRTLLVLSLSFLFVVAPTFGQRVDVDRRIAEVMGDRSYNDISYSICQNGRCEELDESRRGPLPRRTRIQRVAGFVGLAAGIGGAAGGWRGAAAGATIGGGAGLLADTFGSRHKSYRLNHNDGGGMAARVGYSGRAIEADVEYVRPRPRPRFSSGREFSPPEEFRGQMELINDTGFFVSVLADGQCIGKMHPGQRWRVEDPGSEYAYSAEASVPNRSGSTSLLTARNEPLDTGWRFYFPTVEE
ncbi:MAG: hypothetical protein Q8Q06_03230 [bacterium]|nr:hypothetical protein [bacterium]